MTRKWFLRWLFLAVVVLHALPSPAREPAVRCGLTLDRETLPAGGSQTVVVKVSLDAPALPLERGRVPVNLALVLDRSGSMSGDKIAKAREATLEALRRLSPEDFFSVVIYDHVVETLVPAQPARYAEWVEQKILGVYPRGNTALFGAVSQGAAELRKHLDGPFTHRVILLSDGLANVGPSSPRDLGRLGNALAKEGISVTTVGMGTGFNEDLMVQLAEASDGNHYFVESSRDLPRIFATELGEVLSVAARRITVELECPNGIRPLRVIGREGRIRGNRVELSLNQLYGGQEKYVLVEVEIPESAPDRFLEVATARCSYEDALTQAPQSFTARVGVRFSERMEEVRQSVRKEVQEALVENEMAAARDRALDLYNQGQADEAAQELRQAGERLKTQVQHLGLDDLATQAETLDRDAAEFEGGKIGNLQKKEIRSESYRVRTQQQQY